MDTITHKFINGIALVVAGLTIGHLTGGIGFAVLLVALGVINIVHALTVAA